RDRTHARYHVAGAWRSENLEGKAVLRSIIDDGRWADFCADYRQRTATSSVAELDLRLQKACAEQRLTAEQIAHIMGRPITEHRMVA
ncbi:MAG: hypothetical protein ACK6CU_00750, partial [Deltaproteobacteria bacterium]